MTRYLRGVAIGVQGQPQHKTLHFFGSAILLQKSKHLLRRNRGQRAGNNFKRIGNGNSGALESEVDSKNTAHSGASLLYILLPQSRHRRHIRHKRVEFIL